jgi:hypothetical protein
MTAGFMRSLDLLVLFDDHHETFSTHTIPEATAMTRITLNIFDVTPLRAIAIATALSLAFTPLAGRHRTSRRAWLLIRLVTMRPPCKSGSL